MMTTSTRPAQPGELCTCGRQASEVLEGGEFGAVGHCGRSDGGAPTDGVCTFCGDTIDHAHYWRSEREAGRPAVGTADAPQGGRCPLYRLRLADPLPEVHAESVRRYDRVTDLVERSKARFESELTQVFQDLGADFTAPRLLDFPDEDGAPATGDLDDVIFDVVFATHQALVRDGGEVTTEPDAGQTAVAAMVLMLRPRLDELGMSSNPLAGVGARALVDAAGGDDAWLSTLACDRPLLILRRVVRRAVMPAAPWDIYRQWWS